MGSIKFNKQNGRLKRQLPGEDHYSALLFYADVLPTGFSAVDAIKEIAGIEVAESLGIAADAESLGIRIMHYHISELFRINENAILYVGIFLQSAGEPTFSEVSLIRKFAKGKIRQLGVWTQKPYNAAHISLLQEQYKDAFEVFAPYEIFYSANLKDMAIAELPDLSALTGENVHMVIGQDGNKTGAALYKEAGYSVGIIGATIGAVSLAHVHENIGWVEKFNIAQLGAELDVPALSNGTLVSDLPQNYVISEGILDKKRLIFLTTYANITGVYFNDSHSACAATSDFAYAEDNRTIDKAIRGIYIKLAPNINGPVLLEKDTGKLAYEYVQYLQLEAGKALEEMEKSGELSGYAVSIDANQDVNATNQIVINIHNDKVGVSRNFIINIGY